MKRANGHAAAILAALERGPLRRGAHAWLYEVRNGTGFSRSVARTADAVVMSCWPSRGLWLAGIEVKVSRADWLRELDQPEKAAEILRFMDYWWVAAPAGVIEIGEVPETWGYYEIGSGKSKRATAKKPAPKLAPQPLDKSFVAAMLRNQSEQLAAAAEKRALYEQQHAKGEEREEDEVDALRRELAEKKSEIHRLECRSNGFERSLRELQGANATLERSLGIEQGGLGRHAWNGVDRHMLAAKFLVQRAPKTLAAELRAAADSLDGLPDVREAAE